MLYQHGTHKCASPKFCWVYYFATGKAAVDPNEFLHTGVFHHLDQLHSESMEKHGPPDHHFQAGLQPEMELHVLQYSILKLVKVGHM